MAQTRARLRRRPDYLETLKGNNRCQKSRRRVLAAYRLRSQSEHAHDYYDCGATISGAKASLAFDLLSAGPGNRAKWGAS